MIRHYTLMSSIIKTLTLMIMIVIIGAVRSPTGVTMRNPSLSTTHAPLELANLYGGGVAGHTEYPTVTG
ncbi:hypothetical protein HD842_001639 [Massilia aurea]|uniref:Uncharacterized protein n=1 Tax=Massilia aurea TaxID=373040 RepID=A0A7X0CDP2_9BURK|nr:hypothetical protein [Massilia aurea]